MDNLWARVVGGVVFRFQHYLTGFKLWLRRRLASVLYALPFLSRSDPRKHIRLCKDVCVVINDRSACAKLDKDWYLPIASPQTLVRRDPVTIDAEDLARFESGIKPYQDGKVFGSPEVFLSCFHDATVVGSRFVVKASSKTIIYESALSRNDVLEESGVLDNLLDLRAKRLRGTHCLLATPWSSFAYYHWLMDALPRLALIEELDSFRNAALVVPRKLHRFHRETLELLRVRPERLVGVGNGTYAVDRLLVPSTLSTSCNPTPEVVAWLRSKFLSGNAPKGGGARKLYISRRDTKRRVLNEDEVVECLTKKGFQVVCPGELTFAEQVDLFRSAEIVIGPHGAGMANTLFANRGATLIEFFGDNYINGCFWALANVCGHHYGCLTSPTKTLDYVVPVDRINALLDKMGV